MRITIDGAEVPFTEGQTILEAARDGGIYIPTLCAHEGLPPLGACRLCVVKVEGMRGFPPACSIPAADGMVVHSEAEEVMRLRRNVLALILIEHPHACLVCGEREECEKLRGDPEKAGRVTGCSTCPKRPTCEILEVADYLGMADTGIPMVYKGLPVERDDPFLDRDYNLCILCGRCVRMCQDVQGVGAIAFTHRGNSTKVGTLFGRPHLLGPCRFCGACIDVCPTGALSARGSKWHGEPDATTASTCAFCSLGCPVVLEVKWDRVMAAVPGKQRGSGHACACVYGRFCIPAVVNASNRLRYPRIRKDGTLAPVSWDEAFHYVADAFEGVSPAETGFLISPHVTSESAWLIRRLARDVVGTSNIDVLSSFGRAVMRFAADVGDGASAWAGLDDVERADWLLLVKDDVVYSHPALAAAVNCARERGATVILVDDGENDLATSADLKVLIEPGSLRAVLAAVAKGLLVEHGDAVIEGIEALSTSLEGSTHEGAAKLAGISVECLGDITKTLHSSRTGVIVVGPRILDDPEPDQVLAAIRDLLVLRGVERGFMPLVEEGNLRGAYEAGGFLDTSEGDKDVMDALRRGDVKVLVAGEGSIPPDDIPEGTFLVISEPHPSVLDDRADVIFPSAVFTEEDGHFTSLDGRERKLAKAADPPGMAMPDWMITAGLARVMGACGFEHGSSEEVHREMAKAISLFPGKERPSFPSRRELLPIADTCSLHLGEHARATMRYRGTALHELVGDLRIYLEARGRIPMKDSEGSEKEGTR
ncbi:MAG: molybdopterin-dependent oxidoreductase [Candidatus Undinarchaeales archaeon]|jgi:predicted molibdopterin-dependent oxidoreductase YjgC|nr:molybdopterin-dependent oxidoreductase [Candidatus Undinarchaeales archaeon]MDP7492172.1 molybdopterin-dependent oxidoreductase [Candidatus Undinarchaeales archaeon]